MIATPLRMITLCFALAAAIGCSTAAASNGGSLTSSLLGGNCGPTSKPFKPWGDTSSYYLASSFEGGAPGWTMTGGGAVVSGNEPFHVDNAADDTSLSLPAGASATSPNLCFGLTTPGIRFFAVGSNGPATLHVQVITHSLLGLLSILDGGTVTVGTTWTPTPVLSTTLSQLATLTGSKTIQIRITATGGNAQLDDIYIDPFCSK